MLRGWPEWRPSFWQRCLMGGMYYFIVAMEIKFIYLLSSKITKIINSVLATLFIGAFLLLLVIVDLHSLTTTFSRVIFSHSVIFQFFSLFFVAIRLRCWSFFPGRFESSSNFQSSTQVTCISFYIRILLCVSQG